MRLSREVCVPRLGLNHVVDRGAAGRRGGRVGSRERAAEGDGDGRSRPCARHAGQDLRVARCSTPVGQLHAVNEASAQRQASASLAAHQPAQSRHRLGCARCLLADTVLHEIQVRTNAKDGEHTCERRVGTIPILRTADAAGGPQGDVRDDQRDPRPGIGHCSTLDRYNRLGRERFAWGPDSAAVVAQCLGALRSGLAHRYTWHISGGFRNRGRLAWDCFLAGICRLLRNAHLETVSLRRCRGDHPGECTAKCTVVLSLIYGSRYPHVICPPSLFSCSFSSQHLRCRQLGRKWTNEASVHGCRLEWGRCCWRDDVGDVLRPAGLLCIICRPCLCDGAALCCDPRRVHFGRSTCSVANAWRRPGYFGQPHCRPKYVMSTSHGREATARSSDEQGPGGAVAGRDREGGAGPLLFAAIES
eukprot:scaffold64007_cov32-Tisochrysis_lutea.AAC.2